MKLKMERGRETEREKEACAEDTVKAPFGNTRKSFFLVLFLRPLALYETVLSLELSEIGTSTWRNDKAECTCTLCCGAVKRQIV